MDIDPCSVDIDPCSVDIDPYSERNALLGLTQDAWPVLVTVGSFRSRGQVLFLLEEFRLKLMLVTGFRIVTYFIQGRARDSTVRQRSIGGVAYSSA